MLCVDVDSIDISQDLPKNLVGYLKFLSYRVLEGRRKNNRGAIIQRGLNNTMNPENQYLATTQPQIYEDSIRWKRLK